MVETSPLVRGQVLFNISIGVVPVLKRRCFHFSFWIIKYHCTLGLPDSPWSVSRQCWILARDNVTIVSQAELLALVWNFEICIGCQAVLLPELELVIYHTTLLVMCLQM